MELTRCLSVVVAALTLTGCITATITEKNIFAPIQHELYKPTLNPQDMKIRNIEKLGELNSVNVSPQAKLQTIQMLDGKLLTLEQGVIASSSPNPIAYTLARKRGLNRPLSVSCGGNASDRYGTGVKYLEKILPYSDVILFDYPGYGDSPGTATTEAFDAMLSSVVKFSEEKSQGQSLIVWGHSLGGFVCSKFPYYSTKIDGVIIETSAKNITEVGNAIIPSLIKPVIKFKLSESLKNYDNALSLAGFEGRILVIGAGKDEDLPVKLSRSLAEALEASGRDIVYAEFPEAGHFTSSEQPAFEKTLNLFMTSVENQNHDGMR